jgi:hypothetical protein
MLLRYILFFVLLAVVWDFIRRLKAELGRAGRLVRPGSGAPRSGGSARHRDISDAEYEILPPGDPEDSDRSS